MTYEFPSDVARLVREHMAAGKYSTEDDVLRDALHALGQFASSQEEAEEEYRQTVAAVREGLGDFEAGRFESLRSLLDAANAQRSEKE